ncbi:hypothetical protein ATW55_13155 [Ferroacidibacillus organovorans]|uniref:Methyltransferase FkbM domain-containing protein n=2 Tax=Ferroacidibacillus organovorans TaxID=1765683 RepID=A0A101XQK9_9BACL|nr:hypothetical protein ATW55_13155 [Ferroacidibacillus organovorans]
MNDKVCLVDVGANPIDGDAPYKEMLRHGHCRLVGFEPQETARALLNQRKSEYEEYLPYVIGNGQRANLYVCHGSGMTSTLKPDPSRLALFNGFLGLGQVEQVFEVDTKRLDDVTEIERIDYLKIDIQGGELTVFQSSPKQMENVVMIHTEISFMPLYEQQPSFGVLDLELRAQGFVPHAMAALKYWPISPMIVNGDPTRPMNQLLEGDMIYVRDFMKEENMTVVQWKRLAYLAHHLYRSYDLSVRCILAAERLGGLSEGTVNHYMTLLQNEQRLR